MPLATDANVYIRFSTRSSSKTCFCLHVCNHCVGDWTKEFMKENNMKRRHSRDAMQGSEKRSQTQMKPTPHAVQTTGAKPFTGKVFYLDLASNRVSETLESDIKDLGGTVEKFFSKEIKYLVSNKREAKYVHCLRQDSPIPSPDSGPSSPQPCSNPHQPQSYGDSTKSMSQPQKDAVAISRGKSLVKRVVKEQERVHMNKILSNALDWGIKILYLDDVIAYVQKKKRAFCSQQPAKTVKTHIKSETTKRGFQKSKGGRIGKPFVKVEDASRHYRPFYLSLTNIPEFNLTTLPPCTPFCEDKVTPVNRHNGQREVRASTNDERPNERKKKKQGGYCECCLMKYDNITSHLQSDRHKTFAKSDEYLVVDKLVSTMCCSFSHIRSKHKRQKCSVSSVLVAPGPCIEKGKHEDMLDSVVNDAELLLSPSHREAEEKCGSELDSKLSCPAVLDVLRTSKRKLSLSRHKPRQPCPQHLTVEVGRDSQHEGLAPPTGDSATAHSALNEVQLSDHCVLESLESRELPTVKAQTETSESLIETKLPKPESSLCDTLQYPDLVNKQKSDNSVFPMCNSSEDFLSVQSIHRKIKVYKRKRRKVPAPAVSKSVELNDTNDGLMRLWELFQASDDMDQEFYGFE